MNPALIILVFGVVCVAVYLYGRRHDPLGHLREEWGKPIERWRDMEYIAAVYRWRVHKDPQSSYLDDRTWDDLNLDLVFAEIDRTQSTIGRQFLYHRLRTTPTSDELTRFEQLIAYFSTHEEERFSAQRHLSQLAHPAGYRLWSLSQPGTVQRHWWYAAFPILSIAAVGSVIASILISPRALIVLVVIAAVNMVLRLILASSAFHLFALCRQVGPLLKSANGVLSDPTVADILDATRAKNDLRSLRSLGVTTRWASRNFSMENELAGSAWEYLNLLFLVDATSVFLATSTLRRSGPALLRIILSLGEVDSALRTCDKITD